MQIAIGALLAWPTFGLHVEFDPELFLGPVYPRRCFLPTAGRRRPVNLLSTDEIPRLALALVLVTVVGIGFPRLLDRAGYSADSRLCPGGGAVTDRCRGAVRYRGRRAHSEKIMGILQGEALMNDASGFSLAEVCRRRGDGHDGLTVGGATVEFLKVAIGGILAGLS